MLAAAGPGRGVGETGGQTWKQSTTVADELPTMRSVTSAKVRDKFAIWMEHRGFDSRLFKNRRNLVDFGCFLQAI